MGLLGRARDHDFDAEPYERRIAEELEKARQHDAAADACNREVDELAAREAAGEISEREVESRLDALVAKARRGRAAAEQRRRVAGELELRLEQLRAAREAAVFEARRSEFEAASAACVDRSKKVAGALDRLRRDVAALKRDRATADAAREAALSVSPEGFDPFDLAVDDEEPWPEETADLIAFLSAGPRRPESDAELRLARREATQRNEDAHAIRHAVQFDLELPRQHAELSAIARLPERLQARAIAELEAARARTRRPERVRVRA